MLTPCVCPVCRGTLEKSSGGARCPACGRLYQSRSGVLDLLQEPARPFGIAQRIMSSGLLARFYEGVWRPALFRISTGFRMPSLRDERTLVQQALADATGPFLDLSSGPGTFTSTLAGMAHDVVALDLSEPMLRRASARAPRALLVRADAHALPFGDAAFGAVCNMAALDLYADPPKVLAELSRVLAPGGCFVLSTFTLASALSNFRRLRRALGSTGTTSALTKDELEDGLLRQALRAEQIRHFGPYTVVVGRKA